ncbi:MAG: gamma-mobile-trio recombinase GmtY [Cellvibrio sp.]|uniref:gamma-mobile-trio recombinase GmtY n=1 Tax=Cellvibrio sp. TaxID=1965322 RepID=UPI0031A62740
MLNKLKIKAVVSVGLNDKKIKIPVVHIQNHGVLASHVRYLIDKSTHSQSWMRKSVRAIILLLNYIEKNTSLVKNPRQLFEGFFKALELGTNNEERVEENELNWKAREPKDAKELASHVHQFLEYILDNDCIEIFSVSELLKNYCPEKGLSYAAYQHKKNNAFMPYLYNQFLGKPGFNKFSKFSGENPSSAIKTYAFSEDLFMPLLTQGFKVGDSGTWNDWNFRDILITILLHCGGLRESEPFHLYITDISEDPTRKGVALVKLHHPSLGKSPKDFGKTKKRFATRQEYLWEMYGLKPRNESTVKSYHAGWKELALDNDKEKYCYVQWFPTSSGALFLEIWRLYLKTQYSIAGDIARHPFAFTNRHGMPASLSNYIRAHGIAINKIGYEVQKEQGTTPQAHRHAYGTRLRKAGLSPIFTKKAMHHKSISSQQVYTQPSQEELNKQLSIASSKIDSSANENLTSSNPEKTLVDHYPNFYHHQYGSIDPMGVFAPLFSTFRGEK